MVFSQVKNERIRVGDKSHRCDDRGSAELRRRKGIEFDIADVVIQDLELGESAILMLEHGSKVLFIRRVLAARSRCGSYRGRACKRVVRDKEMLIMADGAQVSREVFRELVAVGDGVVIAS